MTIQELATAVLKHFVSQRETPLGVSLAVTSVYNAGTEDDGILLNMTKEDSNRSVSIQCLPGYAPNNENWFTVEHCTLTRVPCTEDELKQGRYIGYEVVDGKRYGLSVNAVHIEKYDEFMPNPDEVVPMIISEGLAFLED